MNLFYRKLLISGMALGTLCLHGAGSESGHMHIPAPYQERQRVYSVANEMNLPADAEMLDTFLSRFPIQGRYVIGMESRFRPLRQLYDTIPAIWARRTPQEMARFKDRAQPGEYYVLQVGVYAWQHDLKDVQMTVSTLVSDSGAMIPESAYRYFSGGGVDIYGKSFTQKVNLPMGHFRGLYGGIAIPEDTEAGVYRGRLTVAPDNGPSYSIDLELTVSGPVIPNHGLDRDLGMSKLFWLNSKAGCDRRLTGGYQPISVVGRRMGIVGRDLLLNDCGLPESIRTYFTGNNRTLQAEGRDILAKPFQFVVELSDGSVETFESESFRFLEKSPDVVRWQAISRSRSVALTVTGRLEYDGYADFSLKTAFLRDVQLRDIRLTIPMEKAMSSLMMGLGKKGGKRPRSWDFKWDLNDKGQDSLWLGGVNGGLYCRWWGPESHSRLINLTYSSGPLRLPQAWGNWGRGGIRVRELGDSVALTAYSGVRSLQCGSVLDFQLQCNITPVKKLDQEIMFKEHYFHAPDVKLAKKLNANMMVIHHCHPNLNEWISHVTLQRTIRNLKRLTDKAHAQGIRIKPYLSQREIAVANPDLMPMTHFDGELTFPGAGEKVYNIVTPDGPHPWLVDHMKRNFIGTWAAAITGGDFDGFVDPSISTRPDSRFDNYFLASMGYFMDRTGMDGIYIDDTTANRTVLRRARKVIDDRRKDGRIDLHSWDHFSHLGYFSNSLLLYVPLLPYIDTLWIGEGRNYNESIDEILVEISGIPFGLPSIMLHPANQWHGILFGMANRGHYGSCPSKVWKFMDDYRLHDSEMIGCWEENVPVSTGDSRLPVTVYRQPGRVILAVGNWDGKALEAHLTLDYKALGLDPDRIQASMPDITFREKDTWNIDFQTGAKVNLNSAVTIPGKQGRIIVLEEVKKK